ncbi:hypothetical protein ABT186_01800 [Streptomyces sp. NPDC001634]|uniref:hypothetical protein n=1 Tax=Streptomyces sp. NPDC001634 TaxID=3154390 RepID=UPI0033210383
MADRWTADELPGLLWEPDHTPARTLDMRAAERLDLWACGLTAWQLHTMTDLKISEEYL